MSSRSARGRPALPIGTVLLGGSILAGAAAAQSLPAPRSEREPNPAAVEQREGVAGIAPRAETQQQQNQVVDQIYRELTGRNPAAPGAAAPPGPAAPPGQAARTEGQLMRELTQPVPNVPASPR